MPDRAYKLSGKLGLPSILGDSGSEGQQEIMRRMYELEEKGFGEGVSGRISFTGHHCYMEGEAFLLDLDITAEYDTPEDRKKIVTEISKAAGSQSSRMLWFT